MTDDFIICERDQGEGEHASSSQRVDQERLLWAAERSLFTVAIAERSAAVSSRRMSASPPISSWVFMRICSLEVSRSWS